MTAQPDSLGQPRSLRLSEPVPARTTVINEVARRVLQMLANGELQPGDRLPSERVLVADLQVSRPAVRAALAVLDLLGFVETRQGAGTFVKSLASEVLPQSVEWGLLLGRPRTLDLVEARAQLEVVIAQLAAERATAAGLDELRAALEEMRTAQADSAAFVAADVNFHMAVAALAGNSVLSDLLTSIRSLLEVWIRRASNDDAARSATLVEHARVVDAISTQDPELARAAMRHHMSGAGTRLRDSLSQPEGEIDLLG